MQALCKIRQNAMQKAVFQYVKGGFSGCERRLFRMRKVAFYIHKYNRLISCKIRTGRLSGHTKAQYCKAADDDAAKNTRFLQVFQI